MTFKLDHTKKTTEALFALIQQYALEWRAADNGRTVACYVLPDTHRAAVVCNDFTKLLLTPGAQEAFGVTMESHTDFTVNFTNGLTIHFVKAADIPQTVWDHSNWDDME